MTTIDILFMLNTLLPILIGIGAGVHFAYKSADNREVEDETPYVVKTTVRRNKNKTNVAGQPSISQVVSNCSDCDREQEKQIILPSILSHRPSMSYVEFDCQSRGEDYKERLVEQMQQQEIAYNYIQNEQQQLQEQQHQQNQIIQNM